MAGNWVNVPFVDGQRLDAADLNDRFENVRTNATAQGTDDYSASVAQSETMLDPGEVGTEVLPTSVADELAVLRFLIKEMKGTPSYRTTYTTLKEQGTVTAAGNVSTLTWDNAVDATIFFDCVVPQLQTATDMAFKLLRRAAIAGGTAIMNINVYRIRDGTAPTLIGSQNAMNFTPGDTLSHLFTATLPMASFTVGDIVRVTIGRLGNDGGDSLTGQIGNDGHWFEYTGVAGRR